MEEMELKGLEGGMKFGCGDGDEALFSWTYPVALAGLE